MDSTLNDVLTILDKHYKNVKALDALNQELFQVCMGNKEAVSDWGVHLSRPSGSYGIIPKSFPSGLCSQAEA